MQIRPGTNWSLIKLYYHCYHYMAIMIKSLFPSQCGSMCSTFQLQDSRPSPAMKRVEDLSELQEALSREIIKLTFF